MNFRILLTCISLMAGLLWAEPVRDKHVATELIAETTHVQPGQPFWLAIKLTMDPHWHTYWRNPGDSGLGTTVDWELPEGYAADPLIWPHPERIASGPLVSYGYENEVALLTLITPPAAETATSLAIRAKAAWLMCEEVCIPGNATLALTIPVRDAAPSADARWTALFANRRAQVPASEVGWTARADVTDLAMWSVDANATVAVDGNSTASGIASAPIPLNVGPNAIAVVVTAQSTTWPCPVFRACNAAASTPMAR